MNKDFESNYARLKEFFRFFCERHLDRAVIDKLPKSSRPITRLEELEKVNMGNAAKGLQMAVNDCLENTSRWPVAKIAEADAELKARGLYSITELRRLYWRKYHSLFKRGYIKNEEEYYLAKSILVDECSHGDLQERNKLGEMVSAYEESKGHP